MKIYITIYIILPKPIDSVYVCIYIKVGKVLLKWKQISFHLNLNQYYQHNMYRGQLHFGN